MGRFRGYFTPDLRTGTGGLVVLWTHRSSHRRPCPWQRRGCQLGHVLLQPGLFCTALRLRAHRLSDRHHPHGSFHGGVFLRRQMGKTTAPCPDTKREMEHPYCRGEEQPGGEPHLPLQLLLRQLHHTCTQHDHRPLGDQQHQLRDQNDPLHLS